MKCARYEIRYVSIARNEAIDPQIKARVIQHAQNCDRCRQFLADQSALTSVLKSFAADSSSTAAIEPVPGLLNAYHQSMTGNPVKTQVPLTRRAWLGAAAVIFLIAAAALVAYPRLNRHRSAGDDAKTVQSGPNKTMQAENAGGASGVTNAEDGEEKIKSAFIPLLHGDVHSDSLEVVRVRLSRSTLQQFGLPMNPERADEPIDADVVLGEDGLPQAIRFIQNQR